MTTDTNIDITTVKALKYYLKKCNMVMVTIRFGTCDCWSKFSKVEAKYIIDHLDPSKGPEHHELGSTFGCYDMADGILYLG